MKIFQCRTLVIATLLVVGLVFGVGCSQDKPVATASPTLDNATLIASPAPLSATQAPDDAALVESSDAALAFPACAPTIPDKVSLPDTFAPAFPFPHGILFSSVTVLNDNVNYLQVIGYAPLELDEADSLVSAALPKAGYEIEAEDGAQGEEDEEDQVVTKFSGNGYRGALRVAAIVNCPAVTQWTVVVIKASE